MVIQIDTTKYYHISNFIIEVFNYDFTIKNGVYFGADGFNDYINNNKEELLELFKLVEYIQNDIKTSLNKQHRGVYKIIVGARYIKLTFASKNTFYKWISNRLLLTNLKDNFTPFFNKEKINGKIKYTIQIYKN
jgi:hypothetical protein